ncbi:MAG: tRNA pseudouridine(13) synthase TruD [Myxococcota bacterium]|nr:tRNA pseudouridine(13) synthase TruD [Myxococcota bacterium]
MIDSDTPPPIAIRPPGEAPATGGGVLKAAPADFVVEEIPAYEPCDEGPFHYLWIEKEDVAGPRLVKEVARRLELPPGEVGCAGMKDRRAITRQWLSVPARQGRDLTLVNGPVGETGRITLLDTRRHSNKLRTGHLKGNRFTIRLPGRDPASDEPTRRRLAVMEDEGFPNAFGPQRFGRGQSVRIGLDALGGRRIRDKRQLRLGVSAVQSWIFNTWLGERVGDGLVATAIEGDLLRKRDSGGVFFCDDPATDNRRMSAGELIVTGPIPGLKGRRATGAAGEREDDALVAAGLTLESFRSVKRLAPGARRDALAFPQACEIRREEDALLLRFTLAPGCYATVLLELLCGPLVWGPEAHGQT